MTLFASVFCSKLSNQLTTTVFLSCEWPLSPTFLTQYHTYDLQLTWWKDWPQAWLKCCGCQILNLTQAMHDNKSPLQLVQMPVVTVERRRAAYGRSRSRNDSAEDTLTQRFSTRSPFFSWCWAMHSFIVLWFCQFHVSSLNLDVNCIPRRTMLFICYDEVAVSNHLSDFCVMSENVREKPANCGTGRNAVSWRHNALLIG